MQNGQNMPLLLDIWIHSWKSVLMFFLVLFAIRCMGKRSVASLDPLDVAVVVIIGNAAAIPIEEHELRLIHGIIPILLIALIHRGVAWASARWDGFQRISRGESTILVRDGKILHDRLIQQRVTPADLWILLRAKNVEQLKDVKMASLEPSGKISVILNTDADAVKPVDFDRLMRNRLAAMVKKRQTAVKAQIDWLRTRR